jgi:hypothetical protein
MMPADMSGEAIKKCFYHFTHGYLPFYGRLLITFQGLFDLLTVFRAYIRGCHTDTAAEPFLGIFGTDRKLRSTMCA